MYTVWWFVTAYLSCYAGGTTDLYISSFGQMDEEVVEVLMLVESADNFPVCGN